MGDTGTRDRAPVLILGLFTVLFILPIEWSESYFRRRVNTNRNHESFYTRYSQYAPWNLGMEGTISVPEYARIPHPASSLLVTSESLRLCGLESRIQIGVHPCPSAVSVPLPLIMLFTF